MGGARTTCSEQEPSLQFTMTSPESVLAGVSAPRSLLNAHVADRGNLHGQINCDPRPHVCARLCAYAHVRPRARARVLGDHGDERFVAPIQRGVGPDRVRQALWVELPTAGDGR